MAAIEAVRVDLACARADLAGLKSELPDVKATLRRLADVWAPEDRDRGGGNSGGGVPPPQVVEVDSPRRLRRLREC